MVRIVKSSDKAKAKPAKVVGQPLDTDVNRRPVCLVDRRLQWVHVLTTDTCDVGGISLSKPSAGGLWRVNSDFYHPPEEYQRAVKREKNRPIDCSSNSAISKSVSDCLSKHAQPQSLKQLAKTVIESNGLKSNGCGSTFSNSKLVCLSGEACVEKQDADVHMQVPVKSSIPNITDQRSDDVEGPTLGESSPVACDGTLNTHVESEPKIKLTESCSNGVGKQTANSCENRVVSSIQGTKYGNTEEESSTFAVKSQDSVDMVEKCANSLLKENQNISNSESGIKMAVKVSADLPLPTNTVEGAALPTNTVEGAALPTNTVEGAEKIGNAVEHTEKVDNTAECTVKDTSTAFVGHDGAANHKSKKATMLSDALNIKRATISNTKPVSEVSEDVSKHSTGTNSTSFAKTYKNPKRPVLHDVLLTPESYQDNLALSRSGFASLFGANKRLPVTAEDQNKQFDIWLSSVLKSQMITIEAFLELHLPKQEDEDEIFPVTPARKQLMKKSTKPAKRSSDIQQAIRKQQQQLQCTKPNTKETALPVQPAHTDSSDNRKTVMNITADGTTSVRNITADGTTSFKLFSGTPYVSPKAPQQTNLFKKLRKRAAANTKWHTPERKPNPEKPKDFLPYESKKTAAVSQLRILKAKPNDIILKDNFSVDRTGILSKKDENIDEIISSGKSFSEYLSTLDLIDLSSTDLSTQHRIQARCLQWAQILSSSARPNRQFDLEKVFSILGKLSIPSLVPINTKHINLVRRPGTSSANAAVTVAPSSSSSNTTAVPRNSTSAATVLVNSSPTALVNSTYAVISTYAAAHASSTSAATVQANSASALTIQANFTRAPTILVNSTRAPTVQVNSTSALTVCNQLGFVVPATANTTDARMLAPNSKVIGAAAVRIPHQWVSAQDYPVNVQHSSPFYIKKIMDGMNQAINKQSIGNSKDDQVASDVTAPNVYALPKSKTKPNMSTTRVYAPISQRNGSLPPPTDQQKLTLMDKIQVPTQFETGPERLSNFKPGMKQYTDRKKSPLGPIFQDGKWYVIKDSVVRVTRLPQFVFKLASKGSLRVREKVKPPTTILSSDSEEEPPPAKKLREDVTVAAPPTCKERTSSDPPAKSHRRSRVLAYDSDSEQEPKSGEIGRVQSREKIFPLLSDLMSRADLAQQGDAATRGKRKSSSMIKSDSDSSTQSPVKLRRLLPKQSPDDSSEGTLPPDNGPQAAERIKNANAILEALLPGSTRVRMLAAATDQQASPRVTVLELESKSRTHFRVKELYDKNNDPCKSNSFPPSSGSAGSKSKSSSTLGNPSTSKPQSKPSTSKSQSTPSTSKPQSTPLTSNSQSKPSTSKPQSNPTTSKPTTSNPQSKPSTSATRSNVESLLKRTRRSQSKHKPGRLIPSKNMALPSRRRYYQLTTETPAAAKTLTAAKASIATTKTVSTNGTAALSADEDDDIFIIDEPPKLYSNPCAVLSVEDL